MKRISASVISVFLLTAMLIATCSTRAHATSLSFNIYFDETLGAVFEHADWRGTYTLTDGKVSAFSASVGDCSLWGAPYCTYNFVFTAPNTGPTNNDPDGVANCCGGWASAFGGSKLSYTGVGPNGESSHLWTTVNTQDSVFQRVGVYRVESTVAEANPFWLILLGIALIACRKCHKL